MKKIVLLFYLLLCVSLFSQETTTITFQPDKTKGKDAFLTSKKSNDNFGSTIALKSRTVEIQGAIVKNRTVIDFDLSSLPNGIVITNAKLTLTPLDNGLNGPSTITINRVINNWEEQSVTWDNQPETDENHQVIIESSSSNSYNNIDIKNLINDRLNNPETNFGMMIQLKTEEPHRTAVFGSSDHPDESKRPKLEITYESYDFYYYGDEKKFVDYNKNKAVIKVTPGFNPSMISNTLFEDMKQIDDFYELFFKPSLSNSEKNTALNLLRKEKNIVYANYFIGEDTGETNDILFKLKEEVSVTTLSEILNELQLTATMDPDLGESVYIGKLNKNNILNATAVSSLLYETGIVEYSQPNYTSFRIYHTNDPLFGNQWVLDNQTGTSTISGGLDFVGAWTKSTGDGVFVAVIDSGVDLNHLDLKANLESGFTITGTNTVIINAGDPGNTQNAHGTAVAGIIGAIANNNIGIAGAAYNCKIIPIRIGPVMTPSKLTKAIEIAKQNGADIINMSIGGRVEYDITIRNKIKDVTLYGRGGKGTILIASAGNNSSQFMEYPASDPNVISVGGYLRDNSIFSNYAGGGQILDVIAPGEGIVTLDISGSQGYGVNDYYFNFDGSSAAAPYVSSIAALILQDHPCLTWQEVRTILRESTNTNYFATYGYGKAHAKRAIDDVYSTDYDIPNGMIYVANNIYTSNPATICHSATETFSVDPFFSATGNYTWEASGGVLIDGRKSPIGGGSSSYSTGSSQVSIDFNETNLSSVTIRVRGNRSCKWVYLNVPMEIEPVKPTDINVVSGSLCDGDVLILESSTSSTHDSYAWIASNSLVVPINSNIIPLPKNQKAFDITGNVGYSVSFNVTASNICGTSSPYYEAFTKASNTPSNYIPIITLPNVYCNGYGNTFTIANPQPGIEYEWFIDDSIQQYYYKESGLEMTSFTPNFGSTISGHGTINTYTIGVRYRLNCGSYGSWSLTGDSNITYSPCLDPSGKAAINNNIKAHEEISADTNPNLLISKIHPNPSKTGVFNLYTLGFKEGKTIQIFDIYGKHIFDLSIRTNSTRIDLSRYSKGMYFVKISDGTNEKTKKVIYE